MRTGALLAVLLGCGRLGFAPAIGDGRVAGDVGDALDGAAPMVGTIIPAVNDGVTQLQWGYTLTSPAMVFVFVATRDANSSAPPSVTSISYGTQAMSRVASLCPMCGPSGINNLEMWALPLAPVGSSTIDVTLAYAASGISTITASYADAGTLDLPATNFGTTTNPTLSWAPSPTARWAIAAAMDQGGFLMSLQAGPGQTLRSDTVCDALDYTAQTVADQIPLSGGLVTFTWTYASGSYGTGAFCALDNTPHAWIVIGASLR